MDSSAESQPLNRQEQGQSSPQSNTLLFLPMRPKRSHCVSAQTYAANGAVRCLRDEFHYSCLAIFLYATIALVLPSSLSPKSTEPPGLDSLQTSKYIEELALNSLKAALFL